MAKCVSCGSELQGNVRFCSACGAPAGNSDNIATIDYAPTATSPLPPKPPSSSSRSSSRPPSSAEFQISEGRFLPGRLIAGRYRIIALLGKGGMGEVYRADDLTLGQAVAMKFLPEEAVSNENLLERFRNEVRTARRISHPNVCRVYDVGEVDGQTFFTMEYVDGEDLASLLRRIGRLPQDKAVEIARQLCAGLAAAHGKGVLHRDLKPANIMLDGRGQAVIMDFGLAGLADDIRGPEVRSGTPAYMAPEQLAGKEVSMRSDLYALGLVLYEVFTGKRAFAEASAQVRHGEGDRTPSRPSSVVKDLDPIVEKVILRCLETEPSARPANALAVAGALPGGDPLAAALAAGETPSPQMVAAAGETEGLRPRTAVAILAGVLCSLAFVIYLSMHYNGYEKMGLEMTPEVLTQKAHEIVSRLGYAGRPSDSAYGLKINDDFQEYVEKNDKPRADWDAVLAGRPSLVEYWYRQSPDDMTASDFHDNLTPGIIGEHDPPNTLSGMINLRLDPQGRLTYFEAIPPQKTEDAAGPSQNGTASTQPASTPSSTPGSTPASTPGPAPVSAQYDWSVLFSAAGLDPAKFQAASSHWNTLAASDTRLAWTGMWPGTTRPLRVEAASFQGKPVFFSLIGDWTKPARMKSTEKKSVGEQAGNVIGIMLLLSGLFGAGFLARKNYLHGRGDREGATRLAILMFLLDVALLACRGHFAGVGDTIGLCIVAMSTGLFFAALTWLLYMAVEPWVRRRWPKTIISWSRLLAGDWRDPVVGRDILVGVGLGVVWTLVFQIHQIPLMRMGGAPALGSTNILMGGRTALGMWLMQWPLSIQSTLLFFLLLLGLKVLLRREWIAGIVFVAIFAVPRGISGSHVAIELPTQIIVYGIALLIVMRFGLLPLAIAIVTINLVANIPVSADLSTWYMTSAIAALLSIVAIAAWGFYHSLGGTPVWKVEME
jgi:predicted Ser/Thr protein kinase